MTERIADKERRLAALAERLVPGIVEALRRGDAALEVAEGIARRLEEQNLEDRHPDVDLKTLYRWVMFVEVRLETKQRRVGLLAAVLLWLGFLGLVAGVVGMSTALAVPMPWGVASAGGVAIIAGIAAWRVGKRRVGVSAEEIIG